MDPKKLSQLSLRDNQENYRRGRKPKKLVLRVAIGLLVLGVVWLLVSLGVFSSPLSVQMVGVGWVYPAQTITAFNASGYVVAQRRASVASKGTGRIERLVVREGSRVKRGDVLAELENEDLKAEHEQAKGQLAAARAELTRAEVEQSDAERNFKRYQKLQEQGVVAQSDYEKAENRYRSALAAVRSIQGNIRALEAAVERTAILIKYTSIVAPFDGVVLTKNADVGEVVAPFGSASNARAAVVTMADLGSLMVEADVAESFISKVYLGQPCEIQLDALPDVRFSGKVDTIVPTADRTKGTVMIKVGFDETDSRILPEMSAKVAFLTGTLSSSERTPFLGVHREALVLRDGTQGLFRIVNDRADWIPVDYPQTKGDYLVVASLLKSGEKVILKPPATLKPGDKVKAEE